MATHPVFSVSHKGLPAFHEAIYVETHEEGGYLYHVVGDNLSGYRYETKATNRPEKSKTFSKKYYKGTVSRDDLATLEAICRQVPPPCHELIGGVIFERDCRHWVFSAFEVLEREKVLKPKPKKGAGAQKPDISQIVDCG
ncbi:hypothetical protein G647_10303 [Cladophialophora carrionii CBS 160.54]|uniref:Uncharacterized protein n=1 Tax=Cladophialophora carrionii CBS 160.54 TaxID=1279043 RepID=V9DLP9_9EURO|nr:uncharacterized protein G647_10303 [Cladophialophora carrionii CBS 160.54]ETI26857.1 hypothetical protein G647_10303 [Cladophialophora carrionii CBS 160.54]